MNFDRFRTKTFEHTLRGALYYWTFHFAYGTVEPFINLYFVQIGFSSLRIGFLAAAFYAMSFITAPLITHLADRLKQRKIVLSISLIFMSIVLILLGLPTAFLPVLLLYALTAVFRAPIIPLADSLASQAEKKTSASFSTMRAIGSLGAGIAAIGFGFIWSLVKLRTMFLIGGLLLFLASIAAQLLVDFPSRKKNPAPLKINDFLQNRTLVYVWAASIPVWAALFMSWTFEGVYAQALGASSALIGMIRGLAILVEVPAMLLSGRWMKKANSVEIMYGAIFLLAAVHFLYALIPSPQWLLGISILKGLGVGLLIPSLVRVVADQAPADYAASYQGLNSALCWGLSALAGSLLGGVLFDFMGGRGMFVICAGLTAAAVLLLYYFLNRHTESIQAYAATMETIPEPEPRGIKEYPLIERPASAPAAQVKRSPQEIDEEIIIQTLERRYSKMLDKE